ncbi:DUF6951 family protein [Methermicoccus shengliensis]|uniref:Uncharacterized protein n=1 Tax=Methermicoccus shengliensis TaxID=660064 RepID=A0A832VXV5_9EURY|nr:hypothetical protein [Methermicoccus shengliensis]KUK04543.1 MAG: hypothetical protein XD46_0763 [Euryarchaeota archaeon 55_53]KUK30627.1 MAG: hypothetical protein XD62_0329 [Methanosarcinales archeaon 56_1174]MDI3488176.1 hypothetical protein [Methanosarcinales archaeon]MDN5295451.1 hypothetical protein [Methanosarcinales archaeon]HIH70217.1 hypothetical protein [Methermicoccus shengliensis]
MRRIRVRNPELERAYIPRISPSERLVARVLVNNPLCGHNALISAQLTPQGSIRVGVKSGCRLIERMVELLPEFTTADLRYVNAGGMYDAVAEARVHSNCLIPPAIIAACMIATGLIEKKRAESAPPTTIHLAPERKQGTRPATGSSKVRVHETLGECTTLIRAKQKDDVVITRIKSNCEDVVAFGEEVSELSVSSLCRANPEGMLEAAEDVGLSPFSFVPPALMTACWIAAGMVAQGLIEGMEPQTVVFMPRDEEVH